MNEIEVVKLPNGIEGFLSGLKPATKTKWNFDDKKYEIDNSSETLEKQKAGCEVVKDALREVYSFGESVSRGTPKFCLALLKVYKNIFFVEDSSADLVPLWGTDIKFKPSFVNGDSGFSKLIGLLGLSSSTAYRYKDIAHFVDVETKEFYSEFQGYSISLLSEIWGYAGESYNTRLEELKKLSEVIPSDTTIEDIRLYRKVMKLLGGYKGVFKNYTYAEQCKLEKKPLSEVLKVYNELEQKAEVKKLEATMSGVEDAAKNDKSVKVLPGTDEMIVKRAEYEKINALAQRAENIGVCDGCKYKDNNLNKCRCCRRYESLKDLFEEN